jgi:RNA polymerase sigma-70 factor (ECF subfamily)
VGQIPRCPDSFVDDLDARYRQALLSYVLHLVNGDRHMAEDVVQETLLRAWQREEVLTPEHRGPWLYTVAHNVAVSAYHRSRPGPPAEVPLEEQTVITTDDEIDRVLLAWETTEALGHLSADHRRVVIELFYRQRSVAETAEVLGIPEGTVRSRCFYALRALRDGLENKGVTRP